jgi:hypothetical protein
MNKEVLPDSRLKDRDLGTQMRDWEMPDGTVQRIECSPVYCANCGVFSWWVPKENTIDVCYLCTPCQETYGIPAGQMVLSEDAFWTKVAYEMMEHYGHILNPQELQHMAETDWGPLKSLVKDSPVKVYQN